MKKKKINKNKKNKSIILRLLIIAVCCYFTLTLADLWGELNDRRKKLAELKNEEARLSEEIEEIEEYQALLDSDSDNEIIEKAARERLGYIQSGEQVFVDISGS